MDCHKKGFGWLQKNVGGHFPCLFHGLDVKELSKIVTGSIFQVSNIIKEDYPEDGRNRWYKASENSSVKDISSEEVIAFSKVLGNYYFNHKIIFNNMNRN